jgi:hypothetical protein
MNPVEYITTHPTLNGLEAYFVATPYNRVNFNLSPYGLNIPEKNLIDPTRSETERFCDLLLKLDSITFGPEGMPMDKWVFYDICYMPGAVIGFGIRANQAPEELRSLYSVGQDEDVLIPLSMYGAIPMATPDAWMGHNLCSIGKRVHFRSFKGLGTLSKALGLKVVRAKDFYGATQWSSVALNVHAKFGPLQLYTAYTPAHSEIHTLTYGFKCDDRSLLSAAGHPDYDFERPIPNLWINPSNEEAMIDLQDRLEAGESFCIPSAPKPHAKFKHEVPVSIVSNNFFNT